MTEPVRPPEDPTAGPALCAGLDDPNDCAGDLDYEDPALIAAAAAAQADADPASTVL